MKIELGTPRQGILTLAKEDGYLMAMKNWEFAAKTDGKVKTLEAFRTYLSKQVQPWDENEAARLESVISSLREKLICKLVNCSSYKPISIIKTSGLDEWRSAYTRESSVILPVNKLDSYDAKALEKLIAHEVFHVLSRYNPEIRARLYMALGFQHVQINIDEHPIFQKQLVNPDALDTNWAIPLGTHETRRWIMPIIFLKDGRLEFDAGDIFERIAFELYVMDADLSQGNVTQVKEIKAFDDAFGEFGFMAHHPEEVLAEAFVDFVYDRNERFGHMDWYAECCEIFKEF